MSFRDQNMYLNSFWSLVIIKFQRFKDNLRMRTSSKVCTLNFQKKSFNEFSKIKGDLQKQTAINVLRVSVNLKRKIIVF